MRPIILRRSFLCLLLAVVGFTTPALAQDPTRISLREAVEIGLEQNVNLRKTENALTFDDIDVEGARSSFLPSLNLSSSLGARYGLGFDLTTGQLAFQSTQSGNASLSSSVPVYQNGHFNLFGLTGNDRSPTVRQALLSRESSQFNFERVRQGVIFDVVTRFLSVINNAEQVKILTENLSVQEKQLERIQEFVRAGSRSVADEYQQMALTAQAELQVINAERTMKMSETSLIQTLELDPFVQYEFVAPSVEDIPLTPQVYDLETLVNTALENRSDVRSQQAAIDANAVGIQIAKAGTLPTVSLSANGGSSYSSLSQSKNAWEQIRDNRAAGLSLSLNFPIYDRGQNSRNIQRAQVQHENSILDLETLEMSVAAEIRQAILDYQTAEKQLEVSEKQLEYSTLARDIEQERYDLNSSTLVELAQANANFVDASSQRSQAVYNFIFQKQLLEYYLGRIQPEAAIFE